jgi:AcrR family transcriptional regulator
MATRLTRPQQVERNRQLVLDAARDVFTEAGYARATLDGIAERAGFSKGVVYSQFASKADLFLALLERRIEERAEQNRALTDGLAPREAVDAFLRIGQRDAHAAPDWQRVLIEFRAHASRDPELNRRYAALHARTIGEIASLLDGMYADAHVDPGVSTRTLAEFVLAVATGITLERSANDDALPASQLTDLITRALRLDGSTQ